MDMNEFARTITLKEGKLKSISIAQVKEVVRLVMEELCKESNSDIVRIVRRAGRGGE